MIIDDIIKIIIGAVVSSSVIAGIVNALINHLLYVKREKEKEILRLNSEKLGTIEKFLFELSNTLDKSLRQFWEKNRNKINENPDFIEIVNSLNFFVDRFSQVFFLNAPFINFSGNETYLKEAIRNVVFELRELEHANLIQGNFENVEKLESIVVGNFTEAIKLINYLNEKLYEIRFGKIKSKIIIKTYDPYEYYEGNRNMVDFKKLGE